MQQSHVTSHIDQNCRFIPEQEYADLLGISVATARKDRWAGKGCKFYKFGSCVRYKLEDVLAYAESCARSSTTYVEA